MIKNKSTRFKRLLRQFSYIYTVLWGKVNKTLKIKRSKYWIKFISLNKGFFKWANLVSRGAITSKGAEGGVFKILGVVKF